ncbi:hypothetical protein [Pseudoduganella sp. R-34]|uniref:hypothetical protein n=1 Tax=unclassified Pseudoduganella TaxID=2637179 RepID=UPI003CE84897
MKSRLLAAAAVFIFICQGSAMAAEFVDEVKEFRSTNKEASADISEIARKYIAAGQSQETVEHYLKAQKFSLNYQPVAAGKVQTLVAVHAGKGADSIGFHDEIRVIVTFEHGVAKRVNSRLIYRAL